MKDDPATPLDLASLEYDLTQSLMPAWTKEVDPSKRLSRLAETSKDMDKPRSGKSSGRDSRSGPPRGRPDPSRNPRGERSQASSPFSQSSQRHPAHSRNSPPSDLKRSAPQVTLTGWTIQILPDSRGMDAMAKQIKSGAKAYPLFDLARLILEKPERYRIEIKKNSDQATTFFHCKADDSLWCSQDEAIQHLLTKKLEVYYRRELTTIDPPKGAYPFVAQCGMSGVLLGPPNFHEYQTKLLKVHSERFANVPFDVYKSRIKMLKDEASIEKWKQEQCAKDIFFARDLTKPAQSPLAASPSPEAELNATAALVSSQPEAVTTSISEDIPVETVEEISQPPLISETPDEAPPLSQVVSPTTNSPLTIDQPTEELKLSSLAEVENHFRTHHSAQVISTVRDRIIISGSVTLGSCARPLLTLIRQTVEELRRFPLPLVHLISRRLSSKGLQLFKAQQNITYISSVRPRYLDYETTPVSLPLQNILKYLESHPKTSRDEQWKSILALEPKTEGATESEQEHTTLANLSWLVKQGHVIDYVQGNLQATKRPQPAQQPKAKSEPKIVSTADPKLEKPVSTEPLPQPEVVLNESIPTSNDVDAAVNNLNPETE